MSGKKGRDVWAVARGVWLFDISVCLLFSFIFHYAVYGYGQYECRTTDPYIPLSCAKRSEQISRESTPEACEPKLLHMAWSLITTGHVEWDGGDHGDQSCFSGKIQCTALTSATIFDLRRLGLMDWTFSFECPPRMADSKADFIKGCLDYLKLSEGINGYTCPQQNSGCLATPGHNYSTALVTSCQGRMPELAAVSKAELKRCDQSIQWAHSCILAMAVITFCIVILRSASIIRHDRLSAGTVEILDSAKDDVMFKDLALMAIMEMLQYDDDKTSSCLDMTLGLLAAVYRYNRTTLPPGATRNLPNTTALLKNWLKERPLHAVRIRELVKQMPELEIEFATVLAAPKSFPE